MESFESIYEEAIEERFADLFIEQLLASPHPAKEGPGFQAAVARQISSVLREQSWYDRTWEARFLLAYCYYWWASFARGYTFEVVIFRDLKQSGIEFAAHNLRSSEERRSSSDLVIQGWEGDIKLSTYFLYAARTQRLDLSFYITRLYDRRQHQRVLAVFVQEEMWQEINGETELCPLEEVVTVFPEAASMRWAGKLLIVIPYEDWKDRVRRTMKRSNL